MDENKTLWNKKADELTVGDAVKLNLAIPAILVGGLVAVGTAYTLGEKAVSKIRKIKKARQNDTDTVVED